MRPRRNPISWVVTPTNSSGASTVRRSIGSCTFPSMTFVTTCGLPTVSSKPSRRIISTNTASCSSPRPCTSQVSGRSVGFTRIETLPISSCSSRAFTSRAVRCLPDLPASGEVLMPMVMEIDGSSTWISGSGFGSFGSERVSPMVISGMPAMATMSPGPADSAGTRSRASVTSSSVSFTFWTLPSWRHHATCWPRFSSPATTRHSASLPR